MKDLTAKDLMTQPAVTVTADASLAEVAQLMLARAIGSVLVTNARGELVGIVTESDFCAKSTPIPFSAFRAPQVLGHWLGREGVEPIYQAARQRPIGEVMTRRVFAVHPDDPLRVVLELMLARDIKHVPVVEGRRPTGLISRHDVLKLVLDQVRA